MSWNQGLLALCFVAMLAPPPASAQERSAYQSARVFHTREGIATVSGSYFREVVQALRTEYGWIVDFEEAPVNGQADLIEDPDLDPTWKKGHPNVKVFARRGGMFVATFQDDGKAPYTLVGEEAILRKVVAEYAATGYPGDYEVRKERDKRFAIIGTYSGSKDAMQPPSKVVLDAPVSIPIESRSASDTVSLILSKASLASGQDIRLIQGLSGYLIHRSISIGGTGVPARKLLIDTFGALGRTLLWSTVYDVNDGRHYINFYTAVWHERPLDNLEIRPGAE